MHQANDSIPLDPYYPLVAGYEWIYRDDASESIVVYAIDRLLRTPAGGKVTFASGGGGEEEFIVSRNGLYRPETPDEPILRFPLKPGAHWSYEDPDLGMVQCHVHGPEEIDTEAGRLRDCYRVVHAARGEPFLTEWYAWEIGLAKWVERSRHDERTYSLCGLVRL